MSPSIPRNLFADILRLIAELPSTTGHVNNMRRSVSRITSQTTREVCLNDRKLAANRPATGSRENPKRGRGSRPFAPIFDQSFSFRLVSDQSFIGSGVASVRRKLPRL